MAKDTPDITSLKSLLDEAASKRRSPVVLFVRRGISTRFIELEPVW